jgi:hypothetical protein
MPVANGLSLADPFPNKVMNLNVAYEVKNNVIGKPNMSNSMFRYTYNKY